MKTHTAEFKSFLETKLNPEQLQAVVQPAGTLLVVAGAGSGKTRVITSRIAYLILNQQALPSSIVALTFTNKAAQEMQQRIKNFLGNIPEIPFIGTFHSYCLKFLKKHQDLLETPFFSILDEDDQHKILSGIIKRNALVKRITPKQLSYQISLLKNQSVNPESLHYLKNDQFLYDIFRAYETEKRACKCLDFDDLLLETVKLLKNNAQLLIRIHQSVDHVLVDEYQDTNIVQHNLLKLLSRKENNDLAISSLCVVGDEDQSIYSWRGATVSNILNFTSDFPDTQIYKIEQNYRSVQPILEVANQIIINNEHRNPKNLWSTRSATDRVLLLACSSEYQEADAITSFFSSVVKHDPLGTLAVLYRAHHQSRIIEEALIKRGIPYKIIGGIQFYDRKEIKDLLAYLRLVVNPYDRPSLLRIINCPARGLGQAFEDQLHEAWQLNPFTHCFELLQVLIHKKILTPTKTQAVKTFLSIFGGLQPSDRPSSVLEVIISKTRYLSYLQDEFDENEAESKADNVKELLQAMKHFENQGISSLGSFLDEVALLQEKIAQSDQEETRSVKLMTLHAAKGLEFDHVAIVGLNEDVLPSSRSVQDPESLEEERRLLYVGVTRSRERLVLSYARNRHTYGQLKEYLPSRFLREIPQDLVARHDFAYENQAMMDAVLRQWIQGSKHQARQSLMTFGSARRIENDTSQTNATDKSLHPSWKKNQPVEHSTFGVGIVQDIELKKNGKTYITAQYKIGIKKIEASFLKPL